MISIFRSNPLLNELDFFFLIETYKWLLCQFGEPGYFHGSKLILPTKEFFPENDNSEEENTRATLDNVKALSGLQHWHCTLQAQVSNIRQIDSAANETQAPGEAHQVNSAEEITVTYNPAIVSVPYVLVSTFTRELAHRLVGTAATEPPGGWVNWDYATDIAATFLGFGIFMVNTSFSVSQLADPYTQGWRAERNAHLSQTEHCMALAIFLLLNQIPFDTAAKYLKPNLRKLLKKSLKELSSSNKIEKLIKLDCQQLYPQQKKIS